MKRLYPTLILIPVFYLVFGFVNESKKMSKRQQSRLLSEAKRELNRRSKKKG